MKLIISLILLGVVIVSESIFTGIIPIYRGDLYGALSSKSPEVYQAILVCFLIYFALDFFQSIKGYIILKTALIFRTRKTTELTLKGALNKTGLDNVPQRIQEDIKLAYLNKITVLCEYFISGTIVLQLIYLNLDQPKLIAAALIYTVISVAIAILFNPKLTATEKEVQKGEASYRESLTKGFNFMSLSVANETSLKAASIRTGYLLFTKLQLGILTMLPYAVLAPALIAGTIDMGTLMKHQGTFSLLVVNAGIIIQLYTTLIQGKASAERVKELE